jgi:hypothetical protein
MRILIAMGNHHRAYREALANALALLRPHLEVEPAAPEEFEGRLESFDPQGVICSLEDLDRREGILVWIDLAYAPEPTGAPARVWIADSYREVPDPNLADLLSAIDEAEGALGAAPERGREPSEPSAQPGSEGSAARTHGARGGITIGG